MGKESTPIPPSSKPWQAHHVVGAEKNRSGHHRGSSLNTCRYTASKRILVLAIENSASTRALALSPMAARDFGSNCNKLPMAFASASGFSLGTTTPASPISMAASPTSVVTHGSAMSIDEYVAGILKAGEVNFPNAAQRYRVQIHQCVKVVIDSIYVTIIYVQKDLAAGAAGNFTHELPFGNGRIHELKVA